MKTRQNPIDLVARVLFLPLGMFLSSCSLIGFGIGAAIDGGKPGKDTLQVEAARGLSVGEAVQVMLCDSTTVEGKYQGVTSLDSATYAGRYRTFVDALAGETAFPMIGDTLFLYTKSGRLGGEYRFRGLGIGTLEVDVISSGGENTARVHFSQLTDATNHRGNQVDLNALKSLTAVGRLPRSLGIAVATESGTVSLPYDDIVQIEKSATKNAKWIGGAIGLAIDVVVAIAVSQLDFSFGGGGRLF